MPSFRLPTPDEAALGPDVTVVRESFDGRRVEEDCPLVIALWLVMDDPDNGRVWQSARIVDLDGINHGLWDRSP